MIYINTTNNRLARLDMNTTNTTSFWSSYPAICFKLPVELKFPDLATPANLASSLFSLVLAGIALPFSVILNTLVLIALYKKPALRSKFNILIGAIAFNDLLGGISEGPLFLYKEIAFQLGQEPNCAVKIALFVSKSILNLSGISLVSTINIERYLAVKYPVWHLGNLTKRNIASLGLFCWFLGIVFTIIRVLFDEGKFFYNYHDTQNDFPRRFISIRFFNLNVRYTK